MTVPFRPTAHPVPPFQYCESKSLPCGVGFCQFQLASPPGPVDSPEADSGSSSAPTSTRKRTREWRLDQLAGRFDRHLSSRRSCTFTSLLGLRRRYSLTSPKSHRACSHQPPLPTGPGTSPRETPGLTRFSLADPTITHCRAASPNSAIPNTERASPAHTSARLSTLRCNRAIVAPFRS
jgi:hypothetical protein